ncbi:alpha/beta hydrolase [Kutzneria viridogrisea]|uniref:Alpha/beta hydrolase n=2 Tax=Kutzneria TaxID=43356 RepID=W5W5H2_9PSEU|nr:alpha/beta fold hydrolase [Kutzneria albida]AHH93459.1 alpha/beta hydrolase [Kutzneria albida DSM 43870]MBA8929155.1 pimeloyl-ACP methyl ester carboxylesterase [Kutzneria viridogrisea]
MPRVTANGIEIEYETFGDPDDPAMLLVMGLGAQLTLWDPEFCRLLAERGFHVIRFDNRDIGLSSSLDDHLPVLDVPAVYAGDFSTVPYGIGDMATDAAELLSELEVDRAHVVGASMGGMIVQRMAIDHPHRLLSVCSIMSTTGDRAVGQATPEAMAALMQTPPTTREEAAANAVRAAQAFGSPGFPLDEAKLAERAAASFERSVRPMGFQRQLAAIVSAPDRTADLREVRLPTLVIHGEQDKLIDVSGGRATAEAVPGAELLVVPGMGHDLPPGAWPQIVDAIAGNTKRAQTD